MWGFFVVNLLLKSDNVFKNTMYKVIHHCILNVFVLTNQNVYLVVTFSQQKSIFSKPKVVFGDFV